MTVQKSLWEEWWDGGFQGGVAVLRWHLDFVVFLRGPQLWIHRVNGWSLEMFLGDISHSNNIIPLLICQGSVQILPNTNYQKTKVT